MTETMFMATTPTRTPRKTPAKKATRKTATAVSQRASEASQAVERGARQLNEQAQPIIAKGKQKLSSAASQVGSVTDRAVKAVKNNPKLAAAVATGVVSIVSALAVKKINKPQKTASLTKKTQETTEQLLGKLADATHALSEKLRK